MSLIPRLLSLVLAAGLSTSALAVEGDWGQVAQALGKSGSEMPGGVYRVGLPRSDLKVMLDGVEVKPALALGSWLAFQKIGNDAMVMGDLVLTAEEVNPVMNKLVEGGIDITALHNHLLRSSPATLYMHVRGHGDPVKLATTLHTAIAESKTPFQGAAYGGAQPAAVQIDLDTAAIDQTLGAKGVINSGVYQFNIPRAEAIIRRRDPSSGLYGYSDRDQLPADRRRKGGHYRRFCARRKGSESGAQGTPWAWYRGDGIAQPHARRAASALFHAFLGE